MLYNSSGRNLKKEESHLVKAIKNGTMNLDKAYDLIVVGSGNGACAFLSKYLEKCDPESKILVLEAGKGFFETSDITHQNNWTKSYSEGQILQLHNAQTTKGIPIVSGYANAMGGGGSINYAMIHESSSWLSNHFGQDIDYWEQLKYELNDRLNCLNPLERQTKLTKYILHSAEAEGFNPQDPHNHIRNIPSYRDLPQGNSHQLYLFSTQFNSFGQRIHSGVSLIDQLFNRIELKTQCQVRQLEFEATESGESRCHAVQVRYLDMRKPDRFLLKDRGRVILCAGAATPRLLMPHRETLKNYEIGKHVSDHIAIPIGIYLLNKDLPVMPQEHYVPIFAQSVWQPEAGESGHATVCASEFFAGNLETLWYFIAHIYLAFLLPNWLKKIVIRQPRWFNFYKGIGIWIEKLNRSFNLWENLNLITAIIKFNPALEGEYESEDNRITLRFFESDRDLKVAENAIAEQLLPLMERLGNKPHPIVKFFLRCYGLPFEKSQVKKYLEHYSKKYLLSQQHMAGGCLFGKAIHKGLDNPQNTGRVKGSTNVHVADLSASPLPRVSTQMTAYLIGFHVAHQLHSCRKPQS